MAWYSYEFWVSEDGQSWRENTDCIPPPGWRIAFAIQWADGEVRNRSNLGRFPFVKLRRRIGTYRPRGDWRWIAEWRNGVLVGSHGKESLSEASGPAQSEAQK